MSGVKDIGNRLRRDKYVYLSAESMMQFLARDNSNSITDDDMENVKYYWDQAAPQRDENGDEVYPGKRSLCSYYRNSGPQRSSGLETTLEYIDPTTVHQVSNQRYHKAWPAEADSHPVLLPLRSFIFNILQTIVSTDEIADYEAMQTAYRVTKSAIVSGDPGPEGIHQDSATLTVIILMGRCNVQGGVNRIWTLEQANGKPTLEDLESDRLLKELVLEQPFDTVMVLDREVKHQVTAISPVDPREPAVRDVLTFEVRRSFPNNQPGRTVSS